jgi:hypothetical protein
MQIAFIALCLVGAWVFWRRRRIDPMLLGFASCVFYFAPALAGRIDKPLMGYSAIIAPDVYGVMIIVMLATIATAVLVDRVPVAGAVPLRVRHVPHVLLGITLCATMVSIFTIGWAYFCEKPEMMGSIDRWYYVAAYCAPLCFATAVAERAWMVVVLAAAVLLIDSLIGYRAGLAIACMAAALVYGQGIVSAGPRSLAIFVLVALLAGFTFVGLRAVMAQVKYPLRVLCVAPAAEPVSLPGSPDALPRTRAGMPVIEHWPAPELRPNLITQMMGEPSIVQATLNEVVTRRFTVDRAHLVQQVKTALPGSWVVFGIEPRDPVTFNLLYQPALFPKVAIGMASNPWAQAYASGGFAMVALFAAGYAIGLGVLTMLFRVTGGALQAIVAVLAGWWGFYAHRNDLMIEIGIIKMVLYCAVAALLVGWLLARFRNGEAPARSPA